MNFEDLEDWPCHHGGCPSGSDPCCIYLPLEFRDHALEVARVALSYDHSPCDMCSEVPSRHCCRATLSSNEDFLARRLERLPEDKWPEAITAYREWVVPPIAPVEFPASSDVAELLTRLARNV